MSSLELALANLLAWSLQAAAIALAAWGVERLRPIERPRPRLVLSQALLALALALPALQPWRAATASVSLMAGPTAAIGTPTARITTETAAAGGWWCAPVALLLAAGAGLRLARVAGALAGLRALRRRAEPFDPPGWLHVLRAEVAPRASFVLLPGAGTPATFGVLRPVVLLPAGFPSLPRERQAQLALHELLHARRADWLLLVAEELVAAALFFHPGIAWLVGRVRLAREQCVDAEVVRRLGGRDGYLETLVDAARARALAGAVPAAPFFHGSHLRERVELLLEEVPMSTARALGRATLSAAVVLAAVALAAGAVPLHSAAAAAAPAEDGPIEATREPKKLHHVAPSYPEAAKAEKVEGVFLVDVVVARDGSIKQAQVTASAPTRERLDELSAKKGTAAAIEGDPRLAEAALVAVRQWRYEPYLLDGVPVEVKMTVTIRFLVG